MVWGPNPAESQPLNMMRRIMDAKEKGAFVAVIDPRFTVTASKADAYLGVQPGTVAALALGLLHVIFREGLQGEAFIRRHTVGAYLVDDLTGAFVRGGDAGLPACPYGAITLDPGGNKAEKCNLCAHRVDQGLEPFCVVCCEGQAMHFGDLEDPESRVSRMVAQREAFLLQPESGSGPPVYYLPPKPRRSLG